MRTQTQAGAQHINAPTHGAFHDGVCARPQAAGSGNGKNQGEHYMRQRLAPSEPAWNVSLYPQLFRSGLPRPGSAWDAGPASPRGRGRPRASWLLSCSDCGPPKATSHLTGGGRVIPRGPRPGHSRTLPLTGPPLRRPLSLTRLHTPGALPEKMHNISEDATKNTPGFSESVYKNNYIFLKKEKKKIIGKYVSSYI